MADLSKERAGEIAIKLIERAAMDREFPAPNDVRREIGNIAKDIDESTEDLTRFFEMLLPKILGRALGRKYVSITTS